MRFMDENVQNEVGMIFVINNRREEVWNDSNMWKRDSVNALMKKLILMDLRRGNSN